MKRFFIDLAGEYLVVFDDRTREIRVLDQVMAIEEGEVSENDETLEQVVDEIVEVKKKRAYNKKAKDEPLVGVQCGHCGERGHNKRRCEKLDDYVREQQGKPDKEDVKPGDENLFGFTFSEADKLVDDFQETEGASKQEKLVRDAGLTMKQFELMNAEVRKRWQENT